MMEDKSPFEDRLAEIGRRMATDRRLIAALLSYLVLAIVAVVALGGFLQGAVLFLLAILAVKTLIHARQAAGD